jgi:hypothetical protein
MPISVLSAIFCLLLYPEHAHFVSRLAGVAWTAASESPASSLPRSKARISHGYPRPSSFLAAGQSPATSTHLSLSNKIEWLLRNASSARFSLSLWHPSELSFFGLHFAAVNDVTVLAALHQNIAVRHSRFSSAIPINNYH